MNITVNVEGLQEVEDALAQAGQKLAKRAVRKGLNASSNVLLDAIRPKVPVLLKGTAQKRPGELRDSLVKKVKLSAKEESGEVVIGPEYKSAEGKQSPGIYGFLVEFGLHGPAQAFMRPGFDEAHTQALKAFTDVMRVAVDSLKS